MEVAMINQYRRSTTGGMGRYSTAATTHGVSGLYFWSLTINTI